MGICNRNHVAGMMIMKVKRMMLTRICSGGWKEDTGTVSGLVGFGKALSFEEGQVATDLDTFIFWSLSLCVLYANL